MISEPMSFKTKAYQGVIPWTYLKRKIMHTLQTLTNKHINGYTVEAQSYKDAFHKVVKIRLRKLAKILGLTTADYDLRTNKAGIAVCGETTLHTDNIYIQVSQSCLGPGHEILYRGCNGRKDYTGKRNHFASISVLDDNLNVFAEIIKIQTM
jgi:hypothetical protein